MKWFKLSLFLFFGLGLFLSGCATGGHYESEIDSLSRKVSQLQGQLEAKDEALTVAQKDAADLRTHLDAAQTEIQNLQQLLAQERQSRSALEEKLGNALSDIEKQKLKSSSSSDSYLK